MGRLGDAAVNPSRARRRALQERVERKLKQNWLNMVWQGSRLQREFRPEPGTVTDVRIMIWLVPS